MENSHEAKQIPSNKTSKVPSIAMLKKHHCITFTFKSKSGEEEPGTQSRGEIPVKKCYHYLLTVPQKASHRHNVSTFWWKEKGCMSLLMPMERKQNSMLVDVYVSQYSVTCHVFFFLPLNTASVFADRHLSTGS